jgi:uncharacterized iron-regulated membrane protein
MRAATVRRWSWVHTWSSLICTVFLLLLCITGLPLIFHHEIDHLLGQDVEPAAVAAGTPHADLDRVVANGLAKHPGEVVQFIIWDRDEPDLVGLSIARKPDGDPSENRFVQMDARTGEYLKDVPFRGTFTYIMLRLHTDMFAGLPGKLFLGLMGLLFVVAIVSGVVVYGSAMRKLSFGTVRRDRSRLVKWLDLHNLLGAVTLMWAVIVGFTGVINTWADLVIKIWQFGQLAEMTAQYKDRPVPAKLASVEQAVRVAREKLPDMTPSFVAYPQSLFTSKSHYAVFMRGNAPLTSRLPRPVLVDAETGAFTDSRDLPWYVTTLLVSQPLHFGDYGGMPLKIVWAILDIFTIVVLVSGLYLWAVRRRRYSSAPAIGEGTVMSAPRP